MAQLVIGLDVGASSIKAVGLERALRGFLPVFFDEEPIGQDADDEGKPLPYPVRARKALDALKARGHLKADIIATALPGDFATSRLIAMPYTDLKKVGATLPNELESAIPFDLEDVVFGWTPVAPPQGTEGLDVLVGLARKQQVEEFIALLKDAGAEPRFVELEALSVENLRQQLLPDAESAEPVLATPGGTVIQAGPGAMPAATAVVDLGASRTSVSISCNGEVLGARTILRGGNDLTRALAREFNLPLDEAEKGKFKEAYLECAESPRVYPEQQRVSTCLKAALLPLVRELRQTFQGMVARRRVRITRILLCGGTSRIPNLDRHLARELNIHVTPITAVDRALAPVLPPPAGGASQPAAVPQAVTAMALALSALGTSRVKRIDFRQGPLAYRGDFEFVAQRAPQIVAGVMSLVLLGAFNAYARHYVISRSEAAVTARQRELCQQIIGQDVDGADRCLAIMREKITPGVTAGAAIPARSALDNYVEMALRMPKGMSVKVEQLEISPEKVRVKGKTDTFESVDKIVKALESGECFKKVEKGPARQDGDKVSWSATVDLECAAPTGAAHE